MTIDLFAGIPVRDYAAAVSWYEQLLGAAPSFLPNDTEAVWYRLTLHTAIGVASAEPHGATRWDFAH